MEHRRIKSIAATQAVAVSISQEEDSREEEQTFLHLLYPEHWKEILKYLSSSDVLSLINYSRQLRESEGFEKEIPTLLLPLVFPLFMGNGFGVNAQTILSMRRLKRSTKQLIDTMLMEEYSPQNYWETITNHYTMWTPLHRILKRICDRIGGVTDTEMLYQHPCLGRRFDVKFSTFHAHNQVMINKFHNYMREHGQNVSQLVCNNIDEIRYVFAVLPLVHNLKVLKLCTKKDYQENVEFVRAVHYPPLPQLECLDLEGFYYDESSIRFYTAFVRHYGVQLKVLNCSDKFFKGWWRFSSWYTQRLQNLEKLRVTQVLGGAYVLNILRKETLPNLQEIYLRILPNQSPDGELIREVLHVLNKCAPTLRSFHLYGGCRRFGNTVVKELVEERKSSSLPNLKIFGTDLFNVSFSDWLWPFIHENGENLEELYFEQPERSRRGRHQVHANIQNRSFQLAPKLERIRITYGVRDREESPPVRIQITRDEQSWRVLKRNEN